MQAIRLLPGIVSVAVPTILSILFFRKRRHSDAFFYAFLFFLSISILMLTGFARQTHWLPVSMALHLVYPSAITAMPVFYLFYLHHLTSVDEQPPRGAYFFFIIPVIQSLFSAYAFYVHDPVSEVQDHFYTLTTLKEHVLYPHYRMAYLAWDVTSALKLAGLASIVVVPVYFIPRIVDHARQEFSNVPKRVVMRFILLFSVACMECVASMIYHFTGQWHITMELFWGAGFLFAGCLMYNEPRIQKTDTNMPAHRKYSEATLLAELTRYFEETKPWQEPELKISDVASALATNRTYISHALKDELKTNFNRFVNRYRIAEAKRLLDEGNNGMKMEDIAFRSGFSCYTTFFIAFRDETRMAPHDYVKGRNGENGKEKLILRK
ncbi:MAG TPA: helix-turn-helix transcriptional regulator [Bacteroidales bacterium]